MVSCRIGGLLATLLCVSLAQLDAFVVTQSTGCHHNGTWYADKSLVPTMEKCLNCQCNRKTLVCRLKVCPEMPMPPPRGCVLVQQKNMCCPYLSCARLEALYKIPNRRRIIAYLDHYERESIDRVVNDNMLQRRSDDSDVDLYVCVKNGTVYKSGSAMSSSNLCTYCYCIGGTEKCVKPKCMLPVDGCKPIYVDSTCCPVRYDCNTKTSGKSSQEVRYRKTANKHFMRMSQRLQRNRGCTVGKQFYGEGQKMKSDPDKPCDLCFCIRGSRRCAPKKCAPALKDCMPVVPKGQCCPSSYDCGHQRDYKRRQNSRQFNLFSLIFGKDDGSDTTVTEIPERYPHDRAPPPVSAYQRNVTKHATNEKSIFDTIREGLEFIDSNNNEMLDENLDLVALQKPKIETKPQNDTYSSSGYISSTTEVSFLDLLLGPSEFTDNETKAVVEVPTVEQTTAGYEGLSWIDLLVDPNDTSSKTSFDEWGNADTTTDLQADATTSIDRLDTFIDDTSGNGEIIVGDLADKQEGDFYGSTTSNEETTTEVNTSTTEVTENETTLRTEEVTEEATQQSSIKGGTAETMVQAKDNLNNTNKLKEPLQKTGSLPLLATKVTFTNDTLKKPMKNADLFAAFIDGINGVLNGKQTHNITTIKTENNTTSASVLSSKPTLITLPTPKPPPLFKPIPTSKPHVRINSKITNLTLNPTLMITKHAPNTTSKPSLPTLAANLLTQKLSSTTPSTTTSTSATTKKHKIITTTVAPVVIKTNPTILEAEPLDENSHPTLPPSLPNLNIIPFLPTDAVQTDPNPYRPSNTHISRIDYDMYDNSNVYPSITERYPTYPDLEDNAKAEYKYKFKVEGPVDTVPSTANTMEVKVGSGAYLKYGLAGGDLQIKGFSPPTETEGGFMPKEPLPIDSENDRDFPKIETNYQLTTHIIDITSALPIVMNTTKVIEITTPDPFKDVIKTEPPPDLLTLIEDKEKILPTIEKLLLSPSKKEEEILHTLTATNKHADSIDTLPAAQHSTTLTTFNETPLYDQKNSIESILSIRIPVKDDTLSSSSPLDPASLPISTVPPFKTLPASVTKHKPIQITTAKPILKPTVPSTQLKTAVTPPEVYFKSKPSIRYNNTTTSTTKSPLPQTTRPRKNTTHRTTKTTTTTTTSTITRKKFPSTSTTSKPNNRTPTTAASISSNAFISATIPASSTSNPFLISSPFDKLPFMKTSFDVRAGTASPPKPNSNDLRGPVHKFEVSTSLSSLLSSSSSPTSSRETSSNSLIDPAGILKLAGCNIYGRMYRVGRIIVELSNPCLECKCTEVGVECGPLDC